MPLSSLVRLLQTSALSGELCERLDRSDRLLLRGAGRAARALVASAMARHQDRPLLVVVPTLEEAGRWTALLELMGWRSAQLYPTSEGSPYEPFDPTSEITWGSCRCSASCRLKGRAVIWRSLPPSVVCSRTCRRRRRWRIAVAPAQGRHPGSRGAGHQPPQLGYERVSTIDQEGTWSRRGDIVDVFPVSSELPVRLEFFGDELDKLREFDPASQRSLDPIDSLRLTPTGFSPLIAESLRDAMPDGLEQLLNEEAITELLEGGTPEGMRRLMGLAWQQPAPARLLAGRVLRRH